MLNTRHEPQGYNVKSILITENIKHLTITIEDYNNLIKDYNALPFSFEKYRLLLKIYLKIADEFAKNPDLKQTLKDWLFNQDVLSKLKVLSDEALQFQIDKQDNNHSTNINKELKSTFNQINDNEKKFPATKDKAHELKNLIQLCRKQIKLNKKTENPSEKEFRQIRHLVDSLRSYKKILFNMAIELEKFEKKHINQLIENCDSLLGNLIKYLEQDEQYIDSLIRTFKNQKELHYKLKSVFQNLDRKDFSKLLENEVSHFKDRQKFPEELEVTSKRAGTNLVFKFAIKQKNEEHAVIIKTYQMNEEYEKSWRELNKVRYCLKESTNLLGKVYGCSEVIHFTKENEMQLRGRFEVIEFFQFGNLERTEGPFTKVAKNSDIGRRLYQENILFSAYMIRIIYIFLKKNVALIDVKPNNFFYSNEYYNNPDIISVNVRTPDVKTARYFEDLTKVAWQELIAAGISVEYLPPEIDPDKMQDGDLVNIIDILKYALGRSIYERSSDRIPTKEEDINRPKNKLKDMLVPDFSNNFFTSNPEVCAVVKSLLDADPKKRMELSKAWSELMDAYYTQVKSVKRLPNKKCPPPVGLHKQKNKEKLSTSNVLIGLNTSLSEPTVKNEKTPDEIKLRKKFKGVDQEAKDISNSTTQKPDKILPHEHGKDLDKTKEKLSQLFQSPGKQKASLRVNYTVERKWHSFTTTDNKVEEIETNSLSAEYQRRRTIK